MKNQYFGDVNDYRKYGLLRTLVGNAEIKASICWMLTNNDAGTDGKFTDYLKHPKQWRKYDPNLFDSLTYCLADKANRSVEWAEENQLIPSASYFAKLLENDEGKRRRYFDQLQSIVAGSDLVFFDPDNGVEVKSVLYGRQRSNKYIYWRELLGTYDSGKSILVYQHFIRANREMFTQQLVDRFFQQFAISEMYSFSTANVLFLLISQPQHQLYFSGKCAEISTNWHSQIKTNKHRRAV